MKDSPTAEKLQMAELRKLESEIVKNEADRAKAAAEEREILKRLNERWFAPRVLFRQGLAGLVAGILLTIWSIGVIKPLVLQKTVEAEHTNKVIELKHQSERLEIADENERLRAENKRNEAGLKEISEQSAALKLEREQAINASRALREKFDVLQTHSEELAKQFGSTSEQNKKLTELAQNAKANANALQEQVEDLRAAQATAAERAERIDVSRQIRDLAIRVFHSPARANEARKLKDELATFGTSVSLFSYAAYANLNPSVKLTHTAGRKADAERIIKLLGDQLEFDKVSVASSDKADVFIHLYGK